MVDANGPHTVETLAALVKTNYEKGQFEIGNLKATLGDIRQDMAEQHTLNRDLMTAMTELKQSVDALRTAKAGRPPGPTDSEGVAEALRDPAARQEATKTFGIQWLIETKEKDLWPADAYQDDNFMVQYYRLKQSGIAGPSDTPLPTASANADVLASAQRPAFIPGKAALSFDSLPRAMPTPSTVSTAFPSQLQLLASMSGLICLSPASSLALLLTLIFVHGFCA